ncbi:uncharacterized protein Dana_GF13755, isoform B [Drosophila ananassae]|uniref:Uncharacterized protein, isoform B n=1 Tax=Drosophila ananassae TaxID=7217 RepID=A0A0P8XRK9_DROAN|nr:uncharacterized protein LOC6496591 isoform X1 [Drosophila ananassae]XP_032311611.1 uncharacterized protein LOC6496591 isoform X1 [Drosophila ananassae]KPU77222.1 uncharacterized protein Dana_GF13755, isoform B [Drosophila ananassae]
MAQETKTAAGAKDKHQLQLQQQQPPNQRQQKTDHIDEDEVSELQMPRNFYDRVREQAERFASTWIGQFVIERTDRALRMIEDTAKWSLPQEKTSAPLERPLPWGPFLMLIILLRLTRMWLSVGALMIGNGPIAPSDMVYFIQTRRRKLRAIRVHGLKVMRQCQQELAYSSGKGLTQKLTQWLSKAMCRPGVQRANSGRLFTVRNMEQTTQTSPAVMKRPREEDPCADPDHNLTIDQMLAKYANENSDNDSDFVPNLEEEDSSSNTSSDESSSESHSSDEISSGEREEMANQVKPPGKKPGVVMENGVHNKAEEKENDKGKLNTIPAPNTNGSNDKEQAEVAPEQAHSEKAKLSQFIISGGFSSLPVAKPEIQRKSSPGPVSATKPNPGHLNSTAAAASNDPDPDPETEPEPESETSVTPIPDPQVQQILELAATLTAQQMSNYPTVDTLTPATSSEDIFYSPIGSPTYFNSNLGTQAPPKTCLPSALAHSTPDLKPNDGADIESSENQKHPHQQKQNHQNHQRQNHSHQRHRGGRNRR